MDESLPRNKQINCNRTWQLKNVQNNHTVLSHSCFDKCSLMCVHLTQKLGDTICVNAKWPENIVCTSYRRGDQVWVGQLSALKVNQM